MQLENLSFHKSRVKKQMLMDSPGKKSVVREVGDEDTVCELYNAREHDKGQEGVDNFELRWRCLLIIAP